MAGKYSLTLQLQLQSPNNVAQVVSGLQKQLGAVAVNLQVKNSKQAAQQVQQLTNATNDAKTAAEKMGDAFGVSLKRFAAFSLASRAIGVFTRYLSNAVDESINFDRQLNKIRQVTRASQGSLNDLSKEITRLATTFGVASSEITDTALILAQAGLSATDTKIALEALTKTRLSATFGDINETAEGAVALIAQFGEGAGALERQLGSLNAVSAKFAVESADLIEVIRRTGGVFKASGGSLEELFGLFTSVRATTRESAESIATALKTIFTRIQRPQTIQYLKQLGVELVNAEGAFVGPYEAIRRLSTAFGSLEQGSLKFIEIAEELGGYRQIGKVIPLLQQFTTAERARQAALAGGTSLTEEAAIAQESLAVQFQKVREEFLSLIRSTTQTDTFKVLTKTVLSLATSLIKVADALKPVLPLLAAFAAIKFTRNIGGFFGGIGAALQKRQFGGKIHAFASGGMVPGSGNRDTVPAMLTPGEFVIRKSSVKKLGAARLAAMNENRYAKGGTVYKQDNKLQFSHIGEQQLVPQEILDTLSKVTKDKKIQGKNLKSKNVKLVTRALGLSLPSGFNQAFKGPPNDLLVEIGEFKNFLKKGDIFKGFEQGRYRLTGPIKEIFKSLDLPKLRLKLISTQLNTKKRQIIKEATYSGPVTDLDPPRLGLTLDTDNDIAPLSNTIKSFLKDKQNLLKYISDPYEIQYLSSKDKNQSNENYFRGRPKIGPALDKRKFFGGAVQRFVTGGDVKAAIRNRELAEGSSKNKRFNFANTAAGTTLVRENEEFYSKPTDKETLSKLQQSASIFESGATGLEKRTVPTFGALFLAPQGETFDDLIGGIDTKSYVDNILKGQSDAAKQYIDRFYGTRTNYRKAFRIKSSTLKESIRDDFENDIYDGILNTVQNATKRLIDKTKIDEGGASRAAEILKKTNIDTTVGNMFDAIIRNAGGKYGSKEVGFDFPTGAGVLVDSFSNKEFPNNIPTEAKASYSTDLIRDIGKKVDSAIGQEAKLEAETTVNQLLNRYNATASTKKAFGGVVQKFATGGVVPGTGNRDTVPAMLTPGEFVIRKSSVEKIGAENLAAMNRGGTVQRFSTGTKGRGVRPPQDLPKDYRINVASFDEEELTYDFGSGGGAKIKDKGTLYAQYYKKGKTASTKEQLFGTISAKRNPKDDFYQIMYAGATKGGGWGSQLYQSLIEYATKKGFSVASDRGSVSPDAFNFWSKLYKGTGSFKANKKLLPKDDWYTGVSGKDGEAFYSRIFSKKRLPPKSNDLWALNHSYTKTPELITDKNRVKTEELKNPKIKDKKYGEATKALNEALTRAAQEKFPSVETETRSSQGLRRRRNSLMRRVIASKDDDDDFDPEMLAELNFLGFGFARGGAVQKFAKGGKAYVFDFDDTLATTEARIGGPNDPDKFSEFRGALGAKLIESAQASKIAAMAKKRYQRGHDVHVLTARPSDEETIEAISQFMRRVGAPATSVVGVGDMFAGEREPGKRPGTTRLLSTGSKKAKILSQIAPDYDETWFIDDAVENLVAAKKVAGVKTVKADLDARKSVQRFWFGGPAADKNAHYSFTRNFDAPAIDKDKAEFVRQKMMKDLPPSVAKKIGETKISFAGPEAMKDRQFGSTNLGLYTNTSNKIALLKDKAGKPTARHELGHAADAALAELWMQEEKKDNSGRMASEIGSTFQSGVASILQRDYINWVKQNDQHLSPTYAMYRESAPELFADAIAKVPSAVRQILTSTTDRTLGFQQLSNYLLKNNKPIPGLGRLSLDEIMPFLPVQGPEKPRPPRPVSILDQLPSGGGIEGMKKRAEMATELLKTTKGKDYIDLSNEINYLQGELKRLSRPRFPKMFAKGGAAPSDTVPALLTPGEFVINRKSAQRIGYGNLNRMNKQGVTGYAKGGPVAVQKFAVGGGAQSIDPDGYNRGPKGMPASISNSANAQIKKLREEIEKLGKSTEGATKEEEEKIKQNRSAISTLQKLIAKEKEGNIAQQKAFDTYGAWVNALEEVDKAGAATRTVFGKIASIFSDTRQKALESTQAMADEAKTNYDKAQAAYQEFIDSTVDVSKELPNDVRNALPPIKRYEELSSPNAKIDPEMVSRQQAQTERDDGLVKKRVKQINNAREERDYYVRTKSKKEKERDQKLKEKENIGKYDIAGQAKANTEIEKLNKQIAKLDEYAKKANEDLQITKKNLKDTVTYINEQDAARKKLAQNEAKAKAPTTADGSGPQTPPPTTPTSPRKNIFSRIGSTIGNYIAPPLPPSTPPENPPSPRKNIFSKIGNYILPPLSLSTPPKNPPSPPGGGGPPSSPPTTAGATVAAASNTADANATPARKKGFDAATAAITFGILQNALMQMAETSGHANDGLKAFSNGLIQVTTTVGALGVQFNTAIEQLEEQGRDTTTVKRIGMITGGLAAAGSAASAYGSYLSERGNKQYEKAAAGAKTSADFAQVQAAGDKNVQDQVFAQKLAGGADVGTFASIGAAIGSIFGPVGTAVGALVGALAGAVSWFIKWQNVNEEAIRVEQNRKDADVAATLAARDSEKAFKDLERGASRFSGPQGLASFTKTIAEANKQQIEAADKTGVSQEVYDKAIEESSQRVLQSASIIGQRAQSEEDARKQIEEMAKNSGFTGTRLKELTKQAGDAAASAIALRKSQEALYAVNLDNARLSSAFNAATLSVKNFMNSLEVGSVKLENTIGTLETASQNINMSGEANAAIDEVEKAIKTSLNVSGSQSSANTGLSEVATRQADRARAAVAINKNIETALAGVSLTQDASANKDAVKKALLDQIPDNIDPAVQEQLKAVVGNIGDITSESDLSNVIKTIQDQLKINFIDPLTETGKALIQQEKVKIELARKRIDAENRLVEAQKSALDLQLESQKTIAEFGGKKVTPADEFAIRAKQFDVGGRAAGVGSVGAGTAEDIRRVSEQVRTRFATQQKEFGTGGQGGGAAELDKDQRERLKKANQDLIALTRQRIEQTKQELQIIKEKNALEKSSIDKLLGGDVEGFMQDQAAASAAQALRSGNTDMLGMFSTQTLGQAAKSLEGQLTPQEFASVLGPVLGRFGIQDSRSAQVYAGATQEEQALMQRGQQEAGLLAELGQNEVGFAQMELKSAEITIQTANVEFQKTLQEAAAKDRATQAAKETVSAQTAATQASQQAATQAATPPVVNYSISDEVFKSVVKAVGDNQKISESLNMTIEDVEKRRKALNLNRGGVVYANRGIFVPRGTDRVPAMLTPGEFVVRREAVQSGNNLQILQAMNRGGGAGSVLSNGVQALAGGGTVQNITNNNNNVNVEQFSAAVNKLQEAISQIPREFFHQFNGSTNMNVTGLAGLTDVMKNIASDAVSQMASKMKTDVTGNVQINGSVLG